MRIRPLWTAHETGHNPNSKHLWNIGHYPRCDEFVSRRLVIYWFGPID